MIAIVDRKTSYSKTWIDYCESNHLDYTLINIYQSDVIKQLEDCTILFWHHSHTNYKNLLFAKQLLFSLEQSGMKVFPNFNTGWHFDDKIGQKYLLESIGAPIIPTYVFYTKKEALLWAKATTFPKVFKLRAGAGGQGVKLVRNHTAAKALINKAFRSGFAHFKAIDNLKERISKYRNGKDTATGILKALVRLIISNPTDKFRQREKGYIYFQEFIPNNTFDTRVIVIGDKAYGMKRQNRKGDFRASGSQNFVYDPIDDNILKIAFETTAKLNLQAVAYDFILSKQNGPLIVELSCFFGTKGSSKCTGYYTSDLVWHPGSFNPIAWIIDNLLNNKTDHCLK